MDRIVTLDSRQEAALQAIADRFIALHKGDAVKALKEMIVLNGHLRSGWMRWRAGVGRRASVHLTMSRSEGTRRPTCRGVSEAVG